MHELIKIFIGIVFVIFGFFIGNFLAKITKEELESGQKWFKIIIYLSSAGAFFSLIFKNDIFLFGFLFIIATTSRSLINKKVRKKVKNAIRQEKQSLNFRR